MAVITRLFGRRVRIDFVVTRGQMVKYRYSDGSESSWVPLNASPGDWVHIPADTETR